MGEESVKQIKSAFEQFILGQFHPCIMARAIFNRGLVDFHVYDELGSQRTAVALLADVKRYLQDYDFTSNHFKTFLAVYQKTPISSEEEFEGKLWQQLQLIYEIDHEPWDEHVSPDPESKNFSFSIGGRAFYIVGLHPKSSRQARRSPYPATALNLHYQFEKLREIGNFTKVRDKIRERDIQLQGSINPMLKDFGEESEALQYSGRQLSKDWRCPFVLKEKN